MDPMTCPVPGSLAEMTWPRCVLVTLLEWRLLLPTFLDQEWWVYSCDYFDMDWVNHQEITRAPKKPRLDFIPNPAPPQYEGECVALAVLTCLLHSKGSLPVKPNHLFATPSQLQEPPSIQLDLNSRTHSPNTEPSSTFTNHVQPLLPNIKQTDNHFEIPHEHPTHATQETSLSSDYTSTWCSTQDLAELGAQDFEPTVPSVATSQGKRNHLLLIS